MSKDLIQAAINYTGCPEAKKILNELVTKAREDAFDYISLFGELQSMAEDIKTLLDAIGEQNVLSLSPKLVEIYEKLSLRYECLPSDDNEERPEDGQVPSSVFQGTSQGTSY